MLTLPQANDHCVKNGDVRTSCCYAIRHGHWRTDKAFFWLLYGPRFFPCASAHSLVNSSTSWFEHLPIRWGNTSQRNGERQRSFGIGESICRLEESQKDRECSTGEFSTSLHVADCKNYLLYRSVRIKRPPRINRPPPCFGSSSCTGSKSSVVRAHPSQKFWAAFLNLWARLCIQKGRFTVNYGELKDARSISMREKWT